MPKTSLPTTYKTLFNQVKQTLILGQQKIEAEKVKIYWETGNLIHAHVKKHEDRAQYGAEVVRQLAADLQVDLSLLNRCVQFAKTYPRSKIYAGRHKFKWSHYRQLIAITDEKQRLSFEDKVEKHDWSSDELIARVNSGNIKTISVKEETPVKQELLTPKRGELYTYRLVLRPELGAIKKERELLLDLGFGIYKRIGARVQSKFSAEQIVESQKDRRDRTLSCPYGIIPSERTAKDLFTYQAVIERVIDADTLKVRIDLGFGLEHRETLRLRDIDAPEIGSKAGDSARVFVQSLLKESSTIILYTSRSDKYDRYLADVFIPADEGEDIFLNNNLLEKGHAQRV